MVKAVRKIYRKRHNTEKQEVNMVKAVRKIYRKHYIYDKNKKGEEE